jgi:hypothetical protein
MTSSGRAPRKAGARDPAGRLGDGGESHRWTDREALASVRDVNQPMSTRKRLMYMGIGVLLLPVLIVVVGLGSRLLGMSADDVAQWGEAMVILPVFAAGVVLLYLQRRGPRPPR